MKKFNILSVIYLTVFLTFISCGGNENDDDFIYPTEMTDLIISSDKYYIVPSENGEEFQFKATNNLGEDITEYAVFYLDDEELSSNTFLPSELGSHQVYAKYSTLESNTITINVVDVLPIYYKHKVSVEDFTGAWCGWCVRILYALDVLEQQTDQIIPIGIHNGDIFDFSGRMVLENELQVEGAYPFATINRRTIWMPFQDQNINQPLTEIQPNSPIGIKINSNLGASSGTVDVSFAFKEDMSENLQYVIYIVENGLMADQTNYTSWYGGVPILYDYVHNHVLRGVQGNILGNNLNHTVTQDSEVSLSDLAVSYSSQNVNNLQVIVMIMNAQGKVLNVQIANGNSEKDYEMAD